MEYKPSPSSYMGVVKAKLINTKTIDPYACLNIGPLIEIFENRYSEISEEKHFTAGELHEIITFLREFGSFETRIDPYTIFFKIINTCYSPFSDECNEIVDILTIIIDKTTDKQFFNSTFIEILAFFSTEKDQILRFIKLASAFCTKTDIDERLELTDAMLIRECCSHIARFHDSIFIRAFMNFMSFFIVETCAEAFYMVNRTMMFPLLITNNDFIDLQTQLFKHDWYDCSEIYNSIFSYFSNYSDVKKLESFLKLTIAWLHRMHSPDDIDHNIIAQEFLKHGLNDMMINLSFPNNLFIQFLTLVCKYTTGDSFLINLKYGILDYIECIFCLKDNRLRLASAHLFKCILEKYHVDIFSFISLNTFDCLICLAEDVNGAEDLDVILFVIYRYILECSKITAKRITITSIEHEFIEFIDDLEDNMTARAIKEILESI